MEKQEGSIPNPPEIEKQNDQSTKETPNPVPVPLNDASSEKPTELPQEEKSRDEDPETKITEDEFEFDGTFVKMKVPMWVVVLIALVLLALIIALIVIPLIAKPTSAIGTFCRIVFKFVRLSLAYDFYQDDLKHMAGIMLLPEIMTILNRLSV